MSGIMVKLAEKGDLGLGLAAGWFITYMSYRIASNDRIKTDRLRFKREQSLSRQMTQKEERIDKLHNQVESLKKQIDTLKRKKRN